tara:strand:- start:1320 stop:2129 length:810 start_codon:yes stop_codon:yes gene_type:complete
MSLTRILIIAYTLSTLITLNAHADDHQLSAAVNDPSRSVKNKARDIYRHPKETLEFFQIKSSMKVLEILPGRGWYTEILAPYLADKGHLTVASFGANHPSKYLANLHNDFVKMMKANSKTYGKVEIVSIKEDSFLQSIPDTSLDMILTFRNSHNWIRYGGITERYTAFNRVLKSGGVLGVVQHRAADGGDHKVTAEKGYVPESYLIRLIEDQGFELMGTSEINSNSKDTKDHPEGVWTLPPSYRLKNIDKEKYTAIGESDRMTLRFVKK